MDTIEVSCPQVNAFLGLAHKERDEPQTLKLDYKISFDGSISAKSGNIVDTVDYVEILGQSRFILWAMRFKLIETAVHCLADYFISGFSSAGVNDHHKPLIESLKLSITKPECLNGVAIPKFTSQRLYEKSLHQPFAKGGRSETPDGFIQRIEIPPASKHSLSIQKGSSYMVVKGEGMLFSSQMPLKPGMAWTSDGQDDVVVAANEKATLVLIQVCSNDPQFTISLQKKCLPKATKGSVLNYNFYESVFYDYS